MGSKIKIALNGLKHTLVLNFLKSDKIFDIEVMKIKSPDIINFGTKCHHSMHGYMTKLFCYFFRNVL